MVDGIPVTVVYILIFLLLVVGISIFIPRITKYKYVINNDRLVIKWYHLGILPIKYGIKLSNIREVHMIDRKGVFKLFLRRWPIVLGKLRKDMIVINKKRGIIRTVVISPIDADGLLGTLKRSI